ncbi:MAG: response regulator [Bdellovibrionaceae bacterium]|nr:response regulator [Pseudobdellovibrionaceae bacterium]
MTAGYKDLKVLIVDDFEIIRITIRTALQKLSVETILEAKDGVEGLRCLQERIAAGGSIDLVFCDWNMPNMTGIQLLGECKNDPNLANIPFVMVTSEADKGNVLEALQIGAADYLVKPFAHESIEKKLKKVLKL